MISPRLIPLWNETRAACMCQCLPAAFASPRFPKMSSSSSTSTFSDSKSRPEHLQLTEKQTRDPTLLDARITRIAPLSPTVKRYTLEITAGNGKFRAGQWVDFFIPGVDKVGGFSLTSSPQRLAERKELDLAIKESDWPPANWLHTKATVGDKVQMRIGGDFHYPNNVITDHGDNSHNVLLVAGGVGINPLASILFHIKDEKSSGKGRVVKTHLLFSAKNPRELIFQDEFEKLQGVDLSSQYFVTNSDEKSAKWRNSRIVKKDLEEAVKCLKGKRLFCFLCGPNSMITRVAEDLEDLGIEKSDIFYELWW